MVRPDKAAAVAELTESFRSSNAAVLTEYRGLTVAQLKELRTSLSGNARYKVVKNTLTRRAANDAGVDAFDTLLAGPTAIAFVDGDAVEVAKGLRDFAKAHPALVIKAGVLDGKALTPEEIGKLADLESREVLLGKLAGAMTASIAGAAALFQAPLTNAARLIEALRADMEAKGGPADASEPEPTADAETDAPAPDEATAEDVAADPVAAEDPVAEVPPEADAEAPTENPET